MKLEFNWKDASKIVATLVITGFVWTVDNQLAVLSLAAMVIVWGVKSYALQTGKQVGKVGLTATLLALSIVFALIFQPVTVMGFPTFDGDMVAFINAVFGWLGTLLLIGKETFAIATGLYNILLADVLKKLEPVPALEGTASARSARKLK